MKAAIIGCNGMGRMHAQMATACGLRIVACGDTKPHIAKALAEQYDAQSSTDCHAVIRRPDVDIVAVTTPTPTHCEYVVAAAEAGKHVFCEKPFGRTEQDCKKAIAAVRKAGVTLFVGHVVRYFQEFEALKAQIDGGAVGTPGFARLYRGGIFPLGIDEWFRDYTQSGGVVLDSMIHDFDWVRYVFGEVERVFCQALRRSEPCHLDYGMATLRMKSGVIVHVTGTWAHPGGFRVGAEVCGDQGMADFDSREAPIHAMMREFAGSGPTMIVPGSPVAKSPYQLEWEDFLAALDGASVARVAPEDALQAVRIGLAALRSAETGKPVKL